MNTNRRRSSTVKREKIIDLTDMGRRNKTSVVRDMSTTEHSTARIRSLSDAAQSQSNIIHLVDEDKDLGPIQGPSLVDPDGQFEEQLEASGATVIKSETYYPASRTTVIKRSMTPEEAAAERNASTRLKKENGQRHQPKAVK